MLDKEIRIKGRTIRNGSEPYVIAEAGSNHDRSLDTALRLVDAAADAGCDAVKFQLFRADKLYPKGTKMHDIFKSIELSPDWVEKLSRHAAGRGMHFLASPFDRESVSTLMAAGAPALKVASSEATNLPLLSFMARQKVPLLLSTGMCDLVDVAQAVDVCAGAGNPSVALLQCGAVYPLPPEQADLRVLDAYRAAFGCPVGYSDHTLGLGTAVAAVGREACVIEKHFTLDKKAKGPDHFYALEPAELKALVRMIREAHAALGASEKRMLEEERKVGRREGLYAARALPAGSPLAGDSIEEKRPALGARARYRALFAGARLREGVEKDAPVSWEQVEF